MKNDWKFILMIVVVFGLIGSIPLIVSWSRSFRTKKIESRSVGPWILVGRQDLNADDYVDFYTNKSTGNHISCVHGRLASAPSCFVDNPVK
jgi:hypothetical protein